MILNHIVFGIVLLIPCYQAYSKVEKLNCKISDHEICKIIRREDLLQKKFPYQIDIKKMKSFTNDVYKISDKDKHYILRLSSPKNEHLVFKNTLSQESENLRNVKKVFKNAPVLILFKPNQYGVFEYIKHKKKLGDEDLKDPKILAKVVLFLRKLHSSNIPFQNDKDVFKDFKKAISIMEDVDQPIEEKKLLFNHLDIIKKKLSLSKNNYVPIHGDPVASNMLIIENEPMVFIDWEYSGRFDAMWDLAMLSVNANFNSDDDERLLTLYMGPFDKDHYERLSIFKSLVHLWKYFWFNLRSLKTNNLNEKEKQRKFAKTEYSRFLKIITKWQKP